jgi:hypothetical protein
MPVNVAMPRNLIDRRKSAGYAAVCAVGFDADPGVFRLATAENLEAHLPQLQPGRWERLHFAHVVWTPGLAVARTIVLAAERFLVNFHLGQHWYRASLETLSSVIAAEASTLRSTIWSHSELIARLKGQADREADRFAEGII